jgi:DNA polymerase III delta prime subunit
MEQIMGRLDLLSHTKYFDLDYEDCTLPLYLRNRLDKWLDKNDLPIMLFSGIDLTLKSTIANALAKKLGMKLEVLVFNKEPKSKLMIKGERTLFEFKKLLSANTTLGQRKLFIFDSIDYFPDDRIPELTEIIFKEKYHRIIIFNYPNHPLNESMRFLPRIAINFKLEHSPKEKQAYIEHCKKLLTKYNIHRTEDEFQDAMKNHHFWGHLLRKEFLSPLSKELKFIEVIPKGRLKAASINAI